jgi:hypothetical protein
MKKGSFSKNCKYHIFNFIELCKKLQKEHGEKGFEVGKYKFLEFSEQMLKDFEKTDGLNYKNRSYVFFDIFINSFLKYIDEKVINEFNNNPDNNRALVSLFFSAIRKYGIIVNLLECNEYENGLILFRAFYENLIILEFLQIHNECIEDFEKYSAYKLNKLSSNTFDKVLNKPEHLYVKNQFNINKMNKDYGWADSIIQKEKINFYNIVENVFENNQTLMTKMGDMYKIISDLSHSNTCALNDPLFQDILYRKLVECLSIFGIPLLKNNFYNLFKKRYGFEMDVFKEILEYIIIK